MIRYSRIAATMTKRRLVILLTIATVFAVVAGVVLATSNSGIISNVVVARAGFVDPVDIKFKVEGHGKEVIQVRDAQETVMQQIIMGPGGYTGWHTHPGPVLVLVKSGTLTLYSGDDPTCTGRTYTAGQAFIEPGQGHVHIGRNEGSENLELWDAYFDVPPGAPSRIDEPSPGNCPF